MEMMTIKRRRTLSHWLIIAILFTALFAAAVASAKALNPAWPGWLTAALAAAAATITISLATWTKAEITASIQRRKERADIRSAGEKALMQELGARKTLLSVRESDPQRLGVHPAIQTSDQDSISDKSALPTYVGRDIDADLRSSLRTASKHGGFVIILGSSCAGKTRTAYEAISDTLADWKILQPSSPSTLSQAVETGIGLEKTVIWLDDLQDYLEDSLDSTVIRRILDASGATVVVATMWSSTYLKYTTLPITADSDSYRRQRAVVKLARILDLADELSDDEIARAKEIATVDARISVAMESEDHGLTQVLAAAPELKRRRSAGDPQSKAVISSAIDCFRLGVRTPLSDTQLRAISRHYLGPADLGSLRESWFEDAISYTQAPTKGATSLLARVSTESEHGGRFGYKVADYLRQQDELNRRNISVPNSLWETLAKEIDIAEDAIRFSAAATYRTYYRIAELALRGVSARDARSRLQAAPALSDLLRQMNRRDEAIAILEEAVEAGDEQSRSQLAHVYELINDSDNELRIRKLAIKEGDKHSVRQMGEYLARQGDQVEAESWLRRALDSGDKGARTGLAKILEERGELAEAEELLLADQTNDAFSYTATIYADFLVRRNRIAEAETVLRTAIDRRELGAGTNQLTKLLESQGRASEIEDVLLLAIEKGALLGHFWLGSHYLQQNEIDKAQSVFEDGLEKGDDTCWLGLINVRRRRGGGEKVGQLISTAIENGSPLVAIFFDGDNPTFPVPGFSNTGVYGREPDGSTAVQWW
jgi:hypothetical protein